MDEEKLISKIKNNVHKKRRKKSSKVWLSALHCCLPASKPGLNSQPIGPVCVLNFSLDAPDFNQSTLGEEEPHNNPEDEWR